MILNDRELRKLIEKGMIKNYIDIDKQLTPQGFDMSVSKIYRINGAGVIDFSNKDRLIPPSKEILWGEGGVFLEKGNYKVKLREYVELPENIIALAWPRSSLLRCGATINNAVWDAGFKGYSEVLLVVGENGLRLKKNARILHMVFFRIENPEKPYNGVYSSKFLHGSH